ncbi:hypothetical protein [Brevundimonas lenta]|uniref:EF-hand domain-containing protein n=1 Tax=Brevundimonas lenta TaxID=424796 RepID=A0A7W6JEU6_9CAUL|nr:hypothetical protein [Brevundimonas lenta]MBB4083860.1 hypothetical protein [Brevundimonas lenta]
MLTLIALSAVLLQEPPAPPAPPAPPRPPEMRAHFMTMGEDGPGGLDKDGDGQVSREEFAAPLNNAFAGLDKDGDGRLSTEEMASGHDSHQVMVMTGAGGPGERRIEIRRDGPGGQASTWTSGGGERTMVFVGEPGPDGAPRVVQGPRGGEWSEEHRVEIRQMGGPGGDHDLDRDGDGKLSEAEFTAPLREAFARMDADQSGFVEQGERGGDGDVRIFTHRVETRHDNEN